MFLAILHGLCGFYIQILPCTFYCLYPFCDSFRYPRKRVLTALGAVLFIMSGIFTYFYVTQNIYSEEHVPYVILNIMFLLTLGILLGVYLFCVRAKTVYKMFVFILVVNYGFLLTETVSYVTDSLLNLENYLYSGSVLVCHLLFNAILFYPMLSLLQHAHRAFQMGIDPEIWKSLTVILGLFIIVLLVFYEIPASAGISRGIVLSFFSKAMEIMLLFLCFIVLRTLETAQRQAARQRFLEAAVENYRLLAETTDQIREARHEMNHHIAALSLLLRDQDYESAERYLDKIANIASETAPVSYTPHLLLNSMLSEYKKRADAKKVQITYHILVPNPIFMEDVDLCQFLSNLLDNALEANSYLDEADRSLTLTIRQTGNFLYFCCKNPYDPAHLHFIDNLSGTNKADKKNHGYGIPIMKRIAEKYNGIFRVLAQDKAFTAETNLCMPAKTEKEL